MEESKEKEDVKEWDLKQLFTAQNLGFYRLVTNLNQRTRDISTKQKDTAEILLKHFLTCYNKANKNIQLELSKLTSNVQRNLVLSLVTESIYTSCDLRPKLSRKYDSNKKSNLVSLVAEACSAQGLAKYYGNKAKIEPRHADCLDFVLETDGNEIRGEVKSTMENPWNSLKLGDNCTDFLDNLSILSVVQKEINHQGRLSHLESIYYFNERLYKDEERYFREAYDEHQKLLLRTELLHPFLRYECKIEGNLDCTDIIDSVKEIIKILNTQCKGSLLILLKGYDTSEKIGQPRGTNHICVKKMLAQKNICFTSLLVEMDWDTTFGPHCKSSEQCREVQNKYFVRERYRGSDSKNWRQ